MLTEEEVRAKLSLDTSVLGRAKRDIAEFAEHGHSGFVHVGSSARSFHQLLHKIREESPLFGGALMTALSPISGAILAAGAALTFVNKKLEEFNARMDEQSKLNAEAITSTRSETVKLGIERDKAAAKEKGWLASLKEVHNEAMKNLEVELQANKRLFDAEQKRLDLRKQYKIAAIGLAGMTGALLPAEAQAQIREAERQHDIQSRQAEQRRLQSDLSATNRQIGIVGRQSPTVQRMAVGAERMARQFEEQAKEAERVLEAEKKSRESPTGPLAEHEKAVETREHGTTFAIGRAVAQGIPLIGPLVGKKLDQIASESDERARQAGQRSIDRTRQQERALIDLNKRQQESAEQSEKWKRKAEELAKQEEELKKKRDEQTQALKDLNAQPLPVSRPESVQSPYTLSSEALAQYNTPFGRIQREINRRNALGQFATAAGRPDIAQNILKSIYGEEVPESEAPGIPGPGQERGSRRGTIRVPAFHRPALMDLLPKGITTESQEINRQRQFVKDILASIGAKEGSGVPVTVVDVRDDSK